MKSTLVPFLLFVALVAVSMTWTNYLSRLAAEKTVRLAIEKGVLLDPEVIARLRAHYRPRWDVRMAIGGIVLSFLGLGISVFGILLAVEDMDALFPMLSIGMGALIPGIGLIVGSWWLRRLDRG